MPARSEAQRRYLNAKFGHDWVKKHDFDNKGRLPKRAPKKHKSGSDREQLMEAFKRRGKKRRHRG